jgi:hypothetical protein
MKGREIRTFRKNYTKYTYDCISEGYKLAVLFDEKDEVKKYGGRWHPYPNDDGGGYWWMPAKHLNDVIHDNGTLLRQWLNENEMIMGQYGKIDTKSHILDNLENADEYELQHKDSTTEFRPENTGTFHVWETIGVAGWNHGAGMAYMTLDDGRAMWDDLMKSGYRRIIREKTLTTEENTV